MRKLHDLLHLAAMNCKIASKRMRMDGLATRTMAFFDGRQARNLCRGPADRRRSARAAHRFSEPATQPKSSSIFNRLAS